ncbi:DUF5906 domain-containing protein [Paucibacter sp. R3-3]|uniref:DUF5906 domain-containing protein n=1 Tax=Roseateles agri TaxID=3098619 RepID=A0ABU5DQB9_9BURK|nr:DUF5906 domain-containing protein [Paucibacter sp. R3-3]MDY0748519.1 DUF5906 domain-containing protein [Paucibacter sp. R3-3]
MPSREQQLRDRARLVQSLARMPQAMRDRQQWLLWRLIPKPKGKPAKVPFYMSGEPRGWPNGKPADGKPTETQPQVEQGDELDRAALVTFGEVMEAIERNLYWAGIGFAFLPGDGLVGVDIDGAIDAESGEVSEICAKVLAMCPGYAERSVSGTGVHIIMAGELESFKSDAIGLEVYCSRQFFTCTGQHWGDSADEPVAIDVEAMATMRTWCEEANERSRDEKRALREAEQLRQAAADGQPVKPKASPKPRARAVQTGDAGDDFRRINDEALTCLDRWVPVVFPGIKPWRDGYRITSKELGRDLQEDLQLLPAGIMDFGEETGKSPVDVVMERRGLSAHEALLWLASCIGQPIEEKRRRSDAPAPARRPEPPDEGEPAAGPAPRGRSPLPPAGAATAPADTGGQEDEEEDDPAPARGKGSAKARPKKLPPHLLENLKVLRERFAYQYGSEMAWDLERREAIKIAHLRYTFGKDAVNVWMASPDRRVIYLEDIVFEPGQELPEDQLNLFAGLPVEPVEGDCAVMVELLTHLCSTSRARATGSVPELGVEEIVDWVLSWCALPLQRIGSKMDTALVFHGPQGTGKNLFFDVLRDLYGAYGVMVGQTELEDKYNTWLSRRMLIVGDEVVSRQEMYHVKNRLKWIITQETKIPIRAMHMDTRWESNHANLVFLSNESQPLALEQGDRRFLVIYTPTAEDGDLYARVRAFLKDGGAAKFLHFLMHYPLDGFSRHTKPPLTEAKASLIERGLKPGERFMHEWIAGYLDLPMGVCSVEQLYRGFRRWADSTGERFWPKQAEFTLDAERFVGERIERDDDGRRLDPLLSKKVVQIPNEGGGRTCARIWIPRGCENREPDLVTGRMVTEGAWAASCIDAFEQRLRRFMHRGRFADGAPEPPDGN